MNELNYIDLFAGAGGLSEGFIREKFKPISHVEMNSDASDTLRTRVAFHHFKQSNNLDPYYSYLKQKFTRKELYDSIPQELLESVINDEISDKSIEDIFLKIDKQLDS